MSKLQYSGNYRRAKSLTIGTSFIIKRNINGQMMVDISNPKTRPIASFRVTKLKPIGLDVLQSILTP